jgi:hypothetical protein
MSVAGQRSTQDSVLCGSLLLVRPLVCLAGLDRACTSLREVMPSVQQHQPYNCAAGTVSGLVAKSTASISGGVQARFLELLVRGLEG